MTHSHALTANGCAYVVEEAAQLICPWVRLSMISLIVILICVSYLHTTIVRLIPCALTVYALDNIHESPLFTIYSLLFPSLLYIVYREEGARWSFFFSICSAISPRDVYTYIPDLVSLAHWFTILHVTQSNIRRRFIIITTATGKR